MSRLLVDTSVWIEFLRDTGSPACEQVGRLLAEPELRVVTTPPIVMELLAGATSEASVRSLEQLTSGIESLTVEPALDFHAAAAAYRACRSRGTTVRGLMDCLLAVIAERHGVTLVHRDADLGRLAACLPNLATVDLR